MLNHKRVGNYNNEDFDWWLNELHISKCNEPRGVSSLTVCPHLLTSLIYARRISIKYDGENVVWNKNIFSR